MPVVQLSDDEVAYLVSQMSPDKRNQLLDSLLDERKAAWLELSAFGQQSARELARQRGLDWDKLTDEARLDFINELVHEDRSCQ